MIEYNKDRTTRQIVKLGPKKVFSARGLAERILYTGFNEGIEVRTPILAPKFQRIGFGTENTRKAYKHGLVLPLSQPETQSEALTSPYSPLQIRNRDFNDLKAFVEQELFVLGYSFRPVQGRDRETRVVPFVSIADGMRLYNWAINNFGGMKVEDYTDAKRSLIEGGEFVVHIPSRTRKRVYRTKMSHVPVVESDHKKAIVWSLDSNFQGGVEPEFSTYNIFFNNLRDVAGSDKKFMYPQQVAAMLAISDYIYKRDKNIVPWDMNVFAKLSLLGAEYDTKLRNNVVIYDPTIKTNKGLRKLHLPERSIMHGRLINRLGHDKTMFWDPDRDPKFKDYTWNLPIE